jgi:type IV secretion system protein VirB10
MNLQEPESDVVQTASQWSKVSQRKSKNYSYVYWLLGSVLAVILVFMLSSNHPKTRSVSTENLMSSDYQDSLNENLARLKAMTAEKSMVTFSDQANQPIHSNTSKEYLARQNAPTNMYSGDIETTNSGTANNTQEATLMGQGSNENFANTSSKEDTVEAKTISHPEYTIASGELLPAVLETAINSDLPGMVRAVVSQPTYSYTGERALIPSGSRLIGQYSSAVIQGQNRVMVIWNRIILPNGITVQLNSPGIDDLGRAGQGADSVNTHFFARFGESALLSLIGAGSATAGVNNQDQNNSSAQYRMAISQSFQQSAEQSLQGTLAIKPTLHIHQGSSIHVFVARDLSFYKVLKKSMIDVG